MGVWRHLGWGWGGGVCGCCWLQGRTGRRLGTRAPLSAGGAVCTMSPRVQENCWGSTLNKVKVRSPSRVRLFATPWTVAYQIPLSMGLSRQEYCISFSRGSSQPRDRTRASWMQADALPSEPPAKSFFFCIVSLAPSIDKTSAPAPQEKLDQNPFSQASPKPRIMWNWESLNP